MIKPIIIITDKKIYVPALKDYYETDFGGDIQIEVDYKDQNFMKSIGGYAIWPLIRFSYDTINYSLDTPFPSAMSKQNLLGTDDQGRDVLARIIYGTRISIIFGILLTVLSGTIGIFIGAIQGYYGGKIDLILQRVIEVWVGLPNLFVIILLSSIFEASFMLLLGIMVLFQWYELVPLIRAEFLKTRNYNYVKYARILGLSDSRIIFRHVLPNSIVSTISILPFLLARPLLLLPR